MRQRGILAVAVSVFAALTIAPTASADAPSGAIFTTVKDGSEVNFNQFPSKDAVYLDGGPGPGAPQTAAGLDDGTYVFQVTEPSGKTLLSQDAAKCRQFVVSGGVITAVVMTGCQHATGDDVDHPPAKTVQLIPYANTPNNGGEYKVWATRKEDFLAGCQALGFPDESGLDEVDCGFKDDETPPKGLNAHGFTTDSSKTDNFKVRNELIREIDSIFYEDENGNGTYDWYKETQLSGQKMIWIDTLKVENTKYSYFLPPFNLTAAHAEAVEKGVHFVKIENQTGCTVGEIYVNDVNHYQPAPGPQTIKVDLSNIKNSDKDVTVQVWVACNS